MALHGRDPCCLPGGCACRCCDQHSPRLGFHQRRRLVVRTWSRTPRSPTVDGFMAVPGSPASVSTSWMTKSSRSTSIPKSPVCGNPPTSGTIGTLTIVCGPKFYKQKHKEEAAPAALFLIWVKREGIRNFLYCNLL